MSRKTEGALLKVLRESVEMSPAELARAINAPASLVSDLEDGENINDKYMSRCSEVLQVVADERAGKLLPGIADAVTGRKKKKKKGK